MNLRAVFFDMGGTLETYRSTPELRAKNTPILRQCLEKAGISLGLSDEELCRLINRGMTAYQQWNRQSLIELSPMKFWAKYVFSDLEIPENKLASVAEELTYLYDIKFFIREMRPEVPGVLQKINSMGLLTGCISNTLSRTQVPATLKKYGIQGYFAPVILSSVYGCRKPDPSVFYHAARLARIPTGSIIYVGDKIDRDILGAKGSGYRLAVKIHHEYDDGEPDLGATPDAVISDMRELIPILENELRQDALGTSSISNHQIKGIFFDAGDVLYHKPHKGMHVNDFLARHGLGTPDNLQRERRKLKDLAFRGRIDRPDYYERIIRLYGVTDPAILEEGVNALLLDATSVEIMNGVPETLKELKRKGFILGIISDTATPIREKLGWFSRAGFGNVFDLFISSKELGIRKPSPAIYQEACRGVRLTVGEAVFVGHKASELKGARTVGLKTVAYNYEKTAKADYYIENFSGLLEIDIVKS